MWSAVLVMAITVIFEPVRIGLAVLMLNRPRPVLQLLAFLSGGFAMGVGVGLVVLFILRATPLAAGGFTVAKVQIVTGLLVLLIAVAMTTNMSTPGRIRRSPTRVGLGGDAGAVVVVDPSPPTGLEKLSAWARHLLQGRSLWIAGVSGMSTSLPSANYMGAMAVILASGAAPLTQAQALLLFNVVAFTLVEIPLVGYLAAPQKTRAFMAALHAWLRARPRRHLAAIVAAGGCVMLGIGIIRL